MAAGYHLKTIFGILLSLSDDPHPSVHFWALEALSKVAESAGLTFSGFVSSALGMLAQRYMADTHNAEISAVTFSNLEFDLPTTAVIGRCLDSLINVLGPDLQDASKVRNLVMTLATQLQKEEDAQVVIGSLHCFEHLSMYAAEHMDFMIYVRNLQSYLNAPEIGIQDAAIDGLYSLIKRGAERVLEATSEGFENQVWVALDGTPDHWGLRKIIGSWLQQTCLSAIGDWIEQIQRVMKQSRSDVDVGLEQETKTINAQPEVQDDEVAGFAAASANNQDTASNETGKEQELLRWQVRAFALDCLSELLATVSKEMTASDGNTPAGTALQERLGDVIRIAFSASTSHVVDLRLRGVRIVDQILKVRPSR